MANLVWARAYGIYILKKIIFQYIFYFLKKKNYKKGLPIERPQSITLDWIENKFSEKTKFEK